MTSEIFWSRIKKSADSECWIWAGSKDKDGYGLCNFMEEKRVPRAVWKLKNGEIPKGHMVLHKCDNPPCCNPAHLFIGTQLDNMRDRKSKGRDPVVIGELNPNRKITAADVIQIRADYASGKFDQPTLGKIYGLHQAHVSKIILRKNWVHI